MKIGKGLSIASHSINIAIFVYFSINLYKTGNLNMLGLLISGFGILVSLIANIVEEID